MTQKTYNGWTNYETWNAALWLDNDQNSYEHARELTQEAIREARDEHDDDLAHHAARRLADLLQEVFESDAENLPSQSSWMADAVNAYLSEVDWYEIAEHYLADEDLKAKDTEDESPA